MIAERTLAQAAHAWGAQGVPFNDEPKTELFRTPSMERATALLNQSAALRSLMLLSGENGVGKSALAGRWLRSLEPKTHFPVCITQASLTGIGLLALFLQKLGKAPKHQRSTNLKLLEEAFAELGRIIPVLLLDEAQNYAMSALEEVRMLLGLNLPEQPTFALIQSRRSIPALGPAPALPSGTLFPDRRSRTDRGPEPFGSRTLPRTPVAPGGDRTSLL
jgi:type II secretory pathway predicted ATPase ExeA